MIRRTEILLIDDDPEDIMLFTNLIEEFDSHINLKIAQNYVDAVDLLFQKHFDEIQSKPHIILLELTISNHKGIQLLKSIKEHSEYRKIPVLVVTKSNNSHDIWNSYDYNVNAYIQKPKSKERYLSLISIMLKFWMEMVSIPDYTWS
ncbi:MAG: response regulator [Candidatus Lokiarchaeota archaeon]|nr:response regulator [Candidatus Lokiarchaeota archaeon]